MGRFIQLHALTSYPPSNLNRDDLGRPKSAIVGGSQRLRVSSQALKRAWRTSPVFVSEFGELGEGLALRTKRLGQEEIYPRLISGGVEPERALELSRDIQLVFGEPDDRDDRGLSNGQLAMVTPVEIQRLQRFVAELVELEREGKRSAEVDAFVKASEKLKKATDKKKGKATFLKEVAPTFLSSEGQSVDLAMFGRMLASSPSFNVDAAAQVAHAITVHSAAVEDDYFTAVDDLNRGEEDRGAGHVSETGFGAGIFYLYVCIDLDLLDRNLGGDSALRNRALAALVRAITQVSPSGKQNSFASRAHASCILAERGDQQPRSLHLAYLRPEPKRNPDEDMASAAIRALRDKRLSLEQMYGASCEDWRAAVEGEYQALLGDKAGSLDQLIQFLQAD